MIKLQKFCALIVLLGLISCDDKAAKPTATGQDFPKFDSLQSSPGIDQLNAVLLTNPKDFGTLSSLGDLYFESSRYFEAIQTYDRAIAVNPMCADCYNDKGLAMFYLGDLTSAIESFDKAVETAPEYTHAWLSKGFVLVSAGRYQEAIAPLNKVKELDTNGVLAAEADKFLAMGAERSGQ